jgi:hypothetical protein
VLFRLIFNILSTDSSTGPIQEDVAWSSYLFPEQNWALKRIFGNRDSNKGARLFLQVGREHANIAMEKLATYNSAPGI